VLAPKRIAPRYVLTPTKRRTTLPQRQRLGRFRIVSAFSLSVVLVGCVRSGHPGTTVPLGAGLAARIDAVAPRGLEETPLSGFSVAIARSDRIVFSKGYGFADISARVPADADTVYRIGSIGKTFIATALVRLAEDGRLSLDDPVAELVPNLAIDPRITVRHLLSHTSGLVNLFVLPGFAESQGIGMTRDQVIGWIVSQPLTAEPGQRFQYNNSGYLVAGVVLDEVTGDGADYISDEIIPRAGLADTHYCFSNVGPAETRGYDVIGEGWERVLRLGRPPGFIPAPPVNMPLIASAGTPCSTVTDLVKWLRALRQGEVVSPTSYRMMSERVELPGDGTTPYGIGLQVREQEGRLTVGHSGLINGFVGRVQYFPAEDVTIAFLTNTSPPHPPDLLWNALLDAALGSGPTEGGLR
jgi:D-alanyl-D-alanine carboxypeptidase